MKIKLNFPLLLQIILFITAAVYVLLTIDPDSDWLVFPATVLDALHHVNLRGWAINAAPSYFPDIFLMFLLNVIISDWQIALRVFNMALILLLPLGAFILNKAYRNKSSPIVMAGMFFFLNIILYDYLSINDPMILKQLGISLHIGTIFMLYVSLGLFFQLMSGARKITYFLYALFIALGAASDILFQIVFTVPMVLVLIYLMINRDKQTFKNECSILVLTIVSAMGGFWASSLFVTHFLYYLPRGIPKMVASGNAGINCQHFPFAWGSFLSICKDFTDSRPILAAVIVVSFIYFIYQVSTVVIKKKYRSKEFILILFVFFCLLADFSVTILTDKISKIAQIRYLYPSIFLLITACLILLENIMAKAEDLAKRIVGVFIVLSLCISLSAIFFVKLAHPYLKVHIYPDIAKCLDDNKDKYGLHDGFSEYWKTHFITMYSKRNIIVNGLRDDNLRIYFWDNNLEVYRGKNYNFIIVDPDPRKVGLKKALVDRIIGKPDDQFSCREEQIYVYDHHQLNQWYEVISREFPKVLHP